VAGSETLGIRTLLAVFAFASCALAGIPPVPLGGEFLVNQQTNLNQYQPIVVTNASGEFAVVWTDDTNIKARVFNADGTPKIPEVLANTSTFGTQNEPQIALADSGRFVVVWSDYAALDGDYLGVIAQRFDPFGQKAGPEFIVNEVTVGSQWEPMVGLDPEENIVFLWVDSIPGNGSNAGVFGRIFDPQGNPLTGQFLVNDSILQAQVNPSLSVQPDGSFTVAWQDRAPIDGSFGRIVARRFDRFGNPLFPGVQVNATWQGDQSHPSVAARPDGSFVVAWTDWGGADGSGGGILFRFFDGAGNPVSGEFQANQTIAGDQAIPEVAWDGASILVVAWTDYAGSDGSGGGVYRRSFDLSGAALEDEAIVSETTLGDQKDIDVAMSPSGLVAFAWEDASGLDGNGSGIFARRYFAGDPDPVPATGPSAQLAAAALLALAGTLLLARRSRNGA